MGLTTTAYDDQLVFPKKLGLGVQRQTGRGRERDGALETQGEDAPWTWWKKEVVGERGLNRRLYAESSGTAGCLQ